MAGISVVGEEETEGEVVTDVEEEDQDFIRIVCRGLILPFIGGLELFGYWDLVDDEVGQDD